MTITKSSYVERITIVLNGDGTLKGAHQNTLNTIAEDGIVIRETQGDAVPLDATALAAVLPTQAALAAQVQMLQDRVDAHDAEKAALQAQIDALTPPAVNGVPQTVTAYQARAALLGAGLLASVEAAVAAFPDEIVRIAWEYATEIRRNSPFIAAMGPALGLDDAAIDALFVAAAQIV